MRVTEASFKTAVFTLNVRTSTAPEFVDITDRVLEDIRASDIRNGLALIYSKHTTARHQDPGKRASPLGGHGAEAGAVRAARRGVPSTTTLPHERCT